MCQVVINDNKQFDQFFCLPRSVYNFRILKKFGHYYNYVYFYWHYNVNINEGGVAPYLLGDKGYPLLSWLMMLHKKIDQSILKMFYNKKNMWV
jgi:hypothetical protein